MRMPPFAGQVQAPLRVAFVHRKFHASGHQPANAARATGHGEAHRLGIAQSGAGGVGVADVIFKRVFRVEHCRDAALGPERTAPGERPLGHNAHPAATVGKAQRTTQAGRTAANHENRWLLHCLPFSTLGGWVRDAFAARAIWFLY